MLVLGIKRRKCDPLGLTWGVEMPATEGGRVESKSLLEENVLFQTAVQSKSFLDCN